MWFRISTIDNIAIQLFNESDRTDLIRDLVLYKAGVSNISVNRDTCLLLTSLWCDNIPITQDIQQSYHCSYERDKQYTNRKYNVHPSHSRRLSLIIIHQFRIKIICTKI